MNRRIEARFDRIAERWEIGDTTALGRTSLTAVGDDVWVGTDASGVVRELVVDAARPTAMAMARIEGAFGAAVADAVRRADTSADVEQRFDLDDRLVPVGVRTSVALPDEPGVPARVEPDSPVFVVPPDVDPAIRTAPDLSITFERSGDEVVIRVRGAHTASSEPWVRISDGTSGSLLATARLRPTADDESVAAMTFGLEVDPEELHVRLTTSPLDPVPPRARRTPPAAPVPPGASAGSDGDRTEGEGTTMPTPTPTDTPNATSQVADPPGPPWWRRRTGVLTILVTVAIALVLILILTGGAADDDPGGPGTAPDTGATAGGQADEAGAVTTTTQPVTTEPATPATTLPPTTVATTTSAAPSSTSTTVTVPSPFPVFGGPSTYGVAGLDSSSYTLTVEGVSVVTSGGSQPLVLSIVEEFVVEMAFNETPISDAANERSARDRCAGTAVGVPASGSSGAMHDRVSEIVLRFVPLEASQDNRFNAPMVRLDAALDSTRADPEQCRTVPLRDGILWAPSTVTRSTQRVVIPFPAGMAPGAYWLEMRTPTDEGIIPTAPITVRVLAPG